MTSLPKLNMPQCPRHAWKTDQSFLADFPLPNGRPSGTKRVYEIRKCERCGATSSRWQPRP